ncbi:MAG: universal stress protein [Ignavibacteria bacterium]|nr:universal stress protein [Ignavibacteria bacterium]
MKKNFKIRKILVPTDFSDMSAQAFGYAEEIASQYDGEIHLLHVLEKTPPILTIRSLDLKTEKIQKTIEDDARTLLKKFAEKFNSSEKVKEVLLRGNDFETITSYAKEKKIDLIVIATHGRTGLLHTLLGSVAEKVIRYAKCPVLVITPSKDGK